MRRLTISAVCLALLPLCATAQQVEPTRELQPQITPAFGLHYGNPARLSAAFGVIVNFDRRDRDGMLVLAEPGRQANELSLGYLRMIGHYGTGVSLRAAVLRTKDDPWDANANATYAGAELHWMVIFGVGGRAGLFRRVGGSPGSHDGLATIGLALGL